VVHLTESKIAVDRYTNRKILVGTARSLYTIDPQTDSGREMTVFATHQLPAPSVMQDLIQHQSNDKFYRNITRKP